VSQTEQAINRPDQAKTGKMVIQDRMVVRGSDLSDPYNVGRVAGESARNYANSLMTYTVRFMARSKRPSNGGLSFGLALVF
jgi:hypothetical protein